MMEIYYHVQKGFCVGKNFKGVWKYWNCYRKEWDNDAFNCWENNLSILTNKCLPEINLERYKSLRLVLSWV